MIYYDITEDGKLINRKEVITEVIPITKTTEVTISITKEKFLEHHASYWAQLIEQENVSKVFIYSEGELCMTWDKTNDNT